MRPKARLADASRAWRWRNRPAATVIKALTHLGACARSVPLSGASRLP